VANIMHAPRWLHCARTPGPLARMLEVAAWQLIQCRGGVCVSACGVVRHAARAAKLVQPRGPPKQVDVSMDMVCRVASGGFSSKCCTFMSSST
jgi:hypothetical protein